MRLLRLFIPAAGIVLACATLAPAAYAVDATRTWISGVGDDANPCSRTAPCKTWAGALSKTTDNGEVDALDPGGFGAVTISKGITLDGGGFASTLHPGQVGVNVNAPANADVVLRNMSINGGSIDPAPASGCPYTSTNGVRVNSARSVRIENSIIGNDGQAAVSVVPTAASPLVVLDNVAIRNGCGAGVDLAPTLTGTASAFIRNSSISRTQTGLRVGQGGHAWLTGSSIFGNDSGLLMAGNGVIDALDTNQIAGNGTNGAPTSTSTSAPQQVITVPGPPQVVTVTTPAPDRCIVPTLSGLTVAAATAKLTKAKCALGKVSTKVSAKKSAGKVLSQKSEAGTTAAAGAKISVTIGKKKTARKRR